MSNFYTQWAIKNVPIYFSPVPVILLFIYLAIFSRPY